MSELKLPRLLAAAKEFNVGQDTLIDFLAKKGFNKDELKPTAKLSEEMYHALQSEFQKDKQAKNKADLVEIPKSQQTERKRKDEEDMSFGRRDDKKINHPAKEEAKVVEPIPAQVVIEPVVPATPAVEIVREEISIVPEPIIAPPPIIQAPPFVEKEITPVPVPVETEQEVEKVTIQEDKTPESSAVIVEQPKAEQPNEPTINSERPVQITKIEAPEIEGPRIVTKIDLNAIDFSTRPKKFAPRKEEIAAPKNQSSSASEDATVDNTKTSTPESESAFTPIQEAKQVENTINVDLGESNIEVSAVPDEKPLPVENEIIVANPVATSEREVVQDSKENENDSYTPDKSTTEEDNSIVIENIQAEKITGPKILGKIELPVDNDTRPKPLSAEDRKKRKRIPVDNRRVGGSHPQQQGANQPAQNKPAQAIGGNQQPHAPQQREGRPGFGQQGGSHSPNITPTTGNSRPVVPANNRNGGAGGGNFNRANNNNQNNNRGSQNNGFNRNQAPGTGNSRPVVRKDDKEIDAKEIQDKIKETQAKLSGGSGRGKSLKAKYRRAKREEAAEANIGADGDDNKLQVTEFVTVSELASLMDVSFADVIGKCMGLGIMVSINQRLDAEVIELVASEFNYEVEFIGLDDVSDEDDDTTEIDLPDNESRPPIVTIMGHVDHGKTSLLDYIRNANVVAGEAGGITQHIGAYEVTLQDGKAITFLDTPGHEAFTAMRARGAKVTDIAVIVVAADDAVMPQTKEAISHAQAAGVPMIFAVNKIDKDGANPQKIYEQLAGMNLLVESWGGKYQSQELSAKKGLAVDLLLEKILLEAELLDVKANASKLATGSVIEASLDKGRGYVATILVQNGTLRQGDIIVSGQHFGRVKAMFNERNVRVEEAPPSTPVVILGLNGAPQAGEKFKVYKDEAEAKEVANKRAQISREQGLRARKHITLDEIGRRLALGNFKELNIIIKGDVDGSVEALSDSLQKLSNQEIAIRIVHKAVGQISESDILLAAASDAIIVGFNVRPSSQANRLAQNEGVQVKLYSIIYTAIDEIRSAMEGMLEPKVEEKEVATIDVREVFKFDKITVAGCYVQEGKVKRDQKIRVFRDGILVYPRQEGGFAELGSLKRYKDDVKEVNNGFECGLTVKGFADLTQGDTIIAYEEEEVKRTL